MTDVGVPEQFSTFSINVRGTVFDVQLHDRSRLSLDGGEVQTYAARA